MSDRRQFEIFSLNKAIYRVHTKILIADNASKDYGRVVINENRFIKSKDIKGRIKDLNGNVLRKLKKKDIRKAQFSPGSVLYSENAYTWADLSHYETPYIVELNYEVQYKSLFFWPDWRPRQNIPVKTAQYSVVLHNPQISFRYYPIGITDPPDTLHQAGQVIYSWVLNDIPARLNETHLPPEHQLQTGILFSPNRFRLGASQAIFKTWQDVANWYYRLASGRYTLPEEAREFVKSIVAQGLSREQIIEQLYQWLQTNTRYVAIYLDIGGWQPNPAESVFTNKYGDCKDLSTLMISMLKEAGIPAYPALMRTRDTGIVFTDFPASQFNHVLVSIPDSADTLWLECTADFCAAGYLPFSREDTDVLLVKPNQAEIVHIPLSPAEDNAMQSLLKGEIAYGGSLLLEGEISYTGNQGNYFRQNWIPQKNDQRLDWLREDILGQNVSKFELKSYHTANIDSNLNQPVKLSFKGRVSNFAVVSSGRIFINPNLLNRVSRRAVPADDERVYPYYYHYAYSDFDSIEIELPHGYRLESAPQPKAIQNSYGEYRTQYRITDNKIFYSRRHKVKTPRIPVEGYPQWRAFLKKVSKNDNSSFVFKKR